MKIHRLSNQSSTIVLQSVNLSIYKIKSMSVAHEWLFTDAFLSPDMVVVHQRISKNTNPT